MSTLRGGAIAAAVVVAVLVSSYFFVYLGQRTIVAGSTVPLTVAGSPSSSAASFFVSSVADRRTSVVAATGASTDNFTLALYRQAGQRAVTMTAKAGIATFARSDFIQFPAGSIASADLPPFDTANDLYFSTFGCSLVTSALDVIDGYLLPFSDGSVVVGQKTFGAAGVTVSLAPFDASLIGAGFKGITEQVSWSTAAAAPASISSLAPATNSSLPRTASAFVARWKAAHPLP